MLYVRFIQGKEVDKAVPFHDPLNKLKLKTLASDCVITKDVATSPLLIYYAKLYNVTSFNKRSNHRNLVIDWN